MHATPVITNQRLILCLFLYRETLNHCLKLAGSNLFINLSNYPLLRRAAEKAAVAEERAAAGLVEADAAEGAEPAAAEGAEPAAAAAADPEAMEA